MVIDYYCTAQWKFHITAWSGQELFLHQGRTKRTAGLQDAAFLLANQTEMDDKWLPVVVVCSRGGYLFVLITFRPEYSFMVIPLSCASELMMMMITRDVKIKALHYRSLPLHLLNRWNDQSLASLLWVSLRWLLMKLIKLYRWMVCHRKQEKNNATLGKESNISGIRR